MSSENLTKVVKILKKQGYRVKQPVDPMDITDDKIRRDWIKNKHMKAFNFYKEEEMKEVDIIIDSPIRYSDAERDVVRIKIGTLSIPVISIRKLIRMKKDTGRLSDQLDVAALKMIEKLKRKEK